MRGLALLHAACFIPFGHSDPAHASWSGPVPPWAQGAVWYQVFPERFCNGLAANDSTTPGAFKPAWNADFYATSTLEVESARAAAIAWGRADRLTDAPSPLHQVMPFRRYGGDLQGLIQRFDHLQSLGVTAIYLSPVFQARSEHKYETSDHRHVDESLGNPDAPRAVWTPIPGESSDPVTWTWTPADRTLVGVLLPEAKRRGLRVILDGVWNHVGTQHWAFQDVLRHGRSSAYADWFRVEFDADGRVRSWIGWPDRANGDLPEFRQTPEGDLAPGPKQHVLAVTRRWMDPNGDGDPSDGIDGWRLDVAPDIGIPFWQDWHALVKQINPDAVTIGEIWMPADRWIDAGCFDAQMNYPLAMALVEFLRGNQDAAWFRRRALSIIDALDAHDLAHMNLLAGHDTERLSSMLANPGTEYDAGRGRLRTPSTYNAARPDAPTKDMIVLAFAILTALPGSPMVFQGDEWAMSGGDDPECRKPVPWPDAGPYASPHDAPDESFPPRLAAWLRLRSDGGIGAVLRHGDVSFPETTSGDVLAVRRSWQGSDVLLVANRADAEFDATFILRAEGVHMEGGPVVPPRSARLWAVDGRGR